MSRRESGEETAAGDGPRQPTASEEASGGSAAVSSLLVSNGTDPSLPSQSQTSAASAAEHADSFATLLTTPLLPANVLRPDTDTLDARTADTERQLQQARKFPVWPDLSLFPCWWLGSVASGREKLWQVLWGEGG